METLTLEAQARNRDDNVRSLRKEGDVPCVVYGNIENTLISCKNQELMRAYVKAGESTVVELKVGDKTIPVLFHVVTMDPVSDVFEHIDFLALDMTKEVTTHVPVHTSGEAPAVKNLSGILVNVQSEVTVTCLPKDLPHAFTVNLEKLAEFGDAITVADIEVPANVTIDEEQDQILIMVQEPRQEAEPEPTEAAEGTEEGAAAEGEKKEGEEKKEEGEKKE